MCCCNSGLAHSEAVKFVLFASDENKRRPIFEKNDLKKGVVKQVNFNEKLEDDKLKWSVKPSQKFWLLER